VLAKCWPKSRFRIIVMTMLRRLIWALWFVLAGAALSIAIGIARDAVPDPAIPYMRPIDLAGDIGWVRRRLPESVMRPLSIGVDGHGWRIDGMRTVIGRWGEERTALRLWRVLPDGTIERDVPATTITVERVRRGWPLLCLEGAIWTPGTLPPQADALLVGPAPGGRTTYLPLRPLWWGLLANALLFGAILLALCRLPGAAERLVRRWRRRCPQCGQPLDPAAPPGGVCPECGFEPSGRSVTGRARSVTRSE
jgi:hypothetical protein